ncbi:GTPase activating protein homolog 2-like [Haliotis asinina]|uniref:GTPase activating protein homolog 2-like n=1 Tax=Haliotis asinina TaxID=109174 RepID=UPI00353223A2
MTPTATTTSGTTPMTPTATTTSGTTPMTTTATTTSGTTPMTTTATTTSGTTPMTTTATTTSGTTLMTTTATTTSETTPMTTTATTTSGTTLMTTTATTTSGTTHTPTTATSTPDNGTCVKDSDCAVPPGRTCSNGVCICSIGYDMDETSVKCRKLTECSSFRSDFILYVDRVIKGYAIDKHLYYTTPADCARFCLNATSICRSFEMENTFCYLQAVTWFAVPNYKRVSLLGTDHYQRRCAW